MREQIRQILAHHGRLAVPISEVDDHADLLRAGLTSLATVSVMLALEEGFDIEFPDRMLKRSVFQSIASISAAIEELTSSG